MYFIFQVCALSECAAAMLLMAYARAFQREALTATDLVAASKVFFF